MQVVVASNPGTVQHLSKARDNSMRPTAPPPEGEWEDQTPDLEGLDVHSRSFLILIIAGLDAKANAATVDDIISSLLSNAL